MAIVKIMTDDGVPKSEIHMDSYDLDSQAKKAGWSKWFVDTVTLVIWGEEGVSKVKEDVQ